jgi:hypothetical protein
MSQQKIFLLAATMLIINMPLACTSSPAPKKEAQSGLGERRSSGTATQGLTRTEEDCQTLGFRNCYSPLGVPQ